MIKKLEYDEKGLDKIWGVSETFIAIENEIIIGMLNVRYNPSEQIREKYGNIGYGVLPSRRKQGIATKLLKIALEKCREKGLKYVVLGCLKENVASSKTILKNGGILYKMGEFEGK